MINPLSVVLAAALALVGFPLFAAEEDSHVAARGDIRVVHAWSRATDGPTAQVFLEIESRGAADWLLGATSEAAESAEIHGAVLEDGAPSSRPLEAIEIPAGGSFALEPGAVFLQLSGLERPLREGDHLDLVLRFERAGALAVEAQVEAADATRHSHAGHAH